MILKMDGKFIRFRIISRIQGGRPKGTDFGEGFRHGNGHSEIRGSILIPIHVGSFTRNWTALEQSMGWSRNANHQKYREADVLGR